MSKHFAWIFWGLLIVFLDFTINGFDLLLDAVGYVVIALGCTGLASYSRSFALAGNLAWALLVGWVLEFFIDPDVMLYYSLLVTAVHCFFIWQLLSGVRDVALQYQRPDLASRAESRRFYYCIVAVAAAVVMVMFQDDADDAWLLVILTVIPGLVLMVMILHLVYRMMNELSGDPPALESA